MNPVDRPEAARPADESSIALHEACARWPDAFAACLKQIDGLALRHATTAVFKGQRHLYLWAECPGHPDLEATGRALLPPDLREVRGIVQDAIT